MIKLTANPLIGPESNWIKISAAMIVVMFESKIALKALRYPAWIADAIRPEILNSSRILSNTNTLASTAIPMVKTIPAIIGSVIAASMFCRTPHMIKMLRKRHTRPRYRQNGSSPPLRRQRRTNRDSGCDNSFCPLFFTQFRAYVFFRQNLWRKAQRTGF